MKIITGGQTGVDLAATNFAIKHGLKYGGWVPKGRVNEDGVIDPGYSNFVEADYEQNDFRTKLNVGSADATLVITNNKKSPGTDLTVEYAKQIGRPILEINLDSLSLQSADEKLSKWLIECTPTVLNIAGPRASEAPDFHLKSTKLLEKSILPFSTSARADRANLRHWDNIRWIVPFWYLSASGAAYTAFDKDKVFQGEVIKIACLMAIIGFACIYLMCRTIRLHNEEVSRIKLSTKNQISSAMENIDFSWQSPMPTATLVFISIQFFVAIAWIFIAVSKAFF